MPRGVRGRLSAADARRALNNVQAFATGLPDGETKIRKAGLQLLAYLLDVCLTQLEANEGQHAGEIGGPYGTLIDQQDQWIEA
jgi:hypothetical protein